MGRRFTHLAGSIERLTAAPNRAALVRRLRRVADQGPLGRFRHGRKTALSYRAAAVRNDLIEVAVRLERSRDPAPRCVAELTDLLTHRHNRPLYNAEIDVSELHRILNRARSELGGTTREST